MDERLRLGKGGTDKSKAREVAQETTGSGMANTCRKTHSAFKSLLGTRSKKSQNWDLGPEMQGLRQQRGQDDSGLGYHFCFR